MKKLTALLLLLPVLASADPGSATQRLLDEPANLMDLGILRLESGLDQVADVIAGSYFFGGGVEDVLVFTSADYDEKDDKIIVRIAIDLTDGKNAEAGCRRVLDMQSRQIAYFVNTLFSHFGSRKAFSPDILQGPLNEHTDIYCTVRTIIPTKTLVKLRKNLASDSVEVLSGDPQ